ncbi:MAG: hypothetical protein J2O48_08120 [Solirubrobacterales bacterium]|nr:hypothetical protein [Solirubrobacterales bacterium]
MSGTTAADSNYAREVLSAVITRRKYPNLARALDSVRWLQFHNHKGAAGVVGFLARHALADGVPLDALLAELQQAWEAHDRPTAEDAAA